MFEWLGTTRYPSKPRVYLQTRLKIYKLLVMNDTAAWVAPHPLMYEALTATLSRKKTTGQPIKNRIQSFVARRTGRASISYMGCSEEVRRSSSMRVADSGSMTVDFLLGFPQPLAVKSRHAAASRQDESASGRS